MATKIDLELTSRRDDGTWTWRAAGARQPKGEVDAGLLPDGASVGDVLKAEIDKAIDGITVVSVQAPKSKKSSSDERLELLGSGRSEQLVTTQLAPKGRGRGDRRDRGDRGDRDRGDRRGRGDRNDRRDRNERGDRRGPRPDRPRRDERPKPPEKPRPKRLKARKTHRKAVIAALPAEQQPLAEVVMAGGIPALRSAIDKQNELAKADDKPLVDAAPLLALGEKILGPMRVAEWHDRADAALASMDTVDIRDLRSVVVAADTAARNDETKALAEQLRTGLAARVEREHAAWLAELDELVREGRVVRALHVSSRPPKAGAPLPAELAERLAHATSDGLTDDIAPNRWVVVLEALALSPVRAQVVPVSVPSSPSDEVLAAVRKEASRLPQIAERFGIEQSDKPARKAPVPPPPPVPPAAQDDSSASTSTGDDTTTSPA